MTESGRVVKFTTDVIDTNGSKQSTEVVRVGAFNIVADGKYLTYSPETGNVTEIPRQQGEGIQAVPQMFLKLAMRSFIWCLTLGGVLASLVARPNLMERVQQGGIVGYLVLLVHLVLE